MGGTDRMRPGDELIKLPAVQAIMGNCAVSTVYEDSELMSRRVSISASEGKSRGVNWIRREVVELRDARIARCSAEADAVRAKVEKQRKHRRDKQRAGTRAAPREASANT